MEVIGADVWQGRWVTVRADASAVTGMEVYDAFADVLAEAEDAVVIGVDMPLTMPAVPPRPGEIEARRLLGPRRSSLFITPSRRVLEAPGYATARRLAVTHDGRGVSAQAYALRHKILEVAPLAEQDDRLHEVHPELAFLEMAGEPLSEAKTTWNGHTMRRRLLAEQGLVLADDLGPAGAAAPADVLDAAAVAWTARRIAMGNAIPLPATGGRGAIWR